MFLKNWRFVYSLVAIVLMIFAGHKLMYLNTSDGKGDLAITSFNCKLLGLYDDNIYSDSLINYINHSNSDIICLQEFYNFKEDHQSVLSKFKKELNYKYVEFMAKVEGNQNNQLGLLLISKYPIRNKGRVPFKTVTSNLCMFADIQVKESTIRVYNAHMQSIRFSKNDHNFIENPDQTEAVEKSKNLIKRMQKAFKIRAEQAYEIKNHMKTTKLPILVCGDFNDTPISYCYRIISEDLKDAFKEKGFGVETTYTGKIPLLRIDYLLHSEQFETTKYRSYKKFPSDHKILHAEVKMR